MTNITTELILQRKKNIYDLCLVQPCKVSDLTETIFINKRKIGYIIELLVKEGKLEVYYDLNDCRSKMYRSIGEHAIS